MNDANFTPRVINALERASTIAKKLNCAFAGTDHLLMAILEDHRSPAFVALESSGMNPEKIKEQLRSMWANEQPVQWTDEERRVLRKILGSISE